MLLISYYAYRGVQYTSVVGSWWNTALGRPPITNGGPEKFESELPRGSSSARRGSGEDESVEDRINALASALGIPSTDLASAIAGVVREYVPPASLSSVAAKETGKVVESLLKDENQKGEKTPGVVEQVVNSFTGWEDDSLV
jgi:hypothetical protein